MQESIAQVDSDASTNIKLVSRDAGSSAAKNLWRLWPWAMVQDGKMPVLSIPHISRNRPRLQKEPDTIPEKDGLHVSVLVQQFQHY